MTNIDTWTRLITSFRMLPRTSRPEPTFIQIAGYPHSENVASNILKFYLHPDQPHGLGLLVLETLLDIAGWEQTEALTVTDVRTEDVTNAGKRIDLVVETDRFVLGIENKIFHTVNNPFAEYHQHLDSLSRGRDVYTILLALHIPDGATLHDFRPVTYQALLDQVMLRLDGRRASAREPYLTYFLDFVKTIRTFYQGSHMDHAILAYFRDNRTDIEDLLGQLAMLRAEMRQKLNDLAQLVEIPQVAYPVRSLGLYRPPTQLYELLAYQIKVLDGLAIHININLSLNGWQLNVFNGEGRREALIAWLQARGVELPIRHMDPFRLIGETHHLPYQTLPAEVGEELINLIRRLTGPELDGS